MAVGADHAGDDVADRHAVAHLRDRGIVVLAEHLQRAVLVLRGLRRDGDISRNSLRLPRKMLLARGIAKRAPERHRALAGPIDPGVRVQARFESHGPGAVLIAIGSHLILLAHALRSRCWRAGRNHGRHRADACRFSLREAVRCPDTRGAGEGNLAELSLPRRQREEPAALPCCLALPGAPDRGDFNHARQIAFPPVGRQGWIWQEIDVRMSHGLEHKKRQKCAPTYTHCRVCKWRFARPKRADAERAQTRLTAVRSCCDLHGARPAPRMAPDHNSQ